ncbi:MAG: glycosyltransferase family 4 protein [Candidatus Latescibacteria bacterium]|nr:glycosyltransferase family 4 protein [Candidatus Latescibacterota bacterium]
MASSILIANDYPPITSGIATVFYEIWRRLPPEQTRVLAPKMPKTQQIDASCPTRIKRIRLPLGESGIAKLLKTTRTLQWTLVQGLFNRPSRIHCGQVISSGIAGLLCKKLYGIPYVTWVYGSETARLAQGGKSANLMRKVLEESEWIITNSNMTSEEFLSFGVPKEKIRRVYPGVDPERFAPTPKNQDWIDKLEIQDKRILLTVARLDQRKGHDKVLQALPHLPDDVVYLIGGTGREEPRLRQIASDLNIEDRVHFLGFVTDEDLPTLYNLCDVFVMPNRVTEGTALAGDIEGFGITFIEAGSCEKPVIAGRSGGAVEAVLDGQTGLLVDPTSETEIVEAILRFLDEPDFAKKMGQQARQRIQKELDWRILAKLVEDIL